MIFSLEGKTAVVTGAAGYFGDSFCKALLDFGCKVILLGRGHKVINKAQEYSAEYGENNVFYKLVDFYNDEDFKQVLTEIIANHEVDILVNNAYEFGPNTGFASD